MPDEDSYPPETARVLKGMTPPRRPAGHEEDLVVTVRLRGDGELVVSSPGMSPAPHRRHPGEARPGRRAAGR